MPRQSSRSPPPAAAAAGAEPQHPVPMKQGASVVRLPAIGGRQAKQQQHQHRAGDHHGGDARRGHGVRDGRGGRGGGAEHASASSALVPYQVADRELESRSSTVVPRVGSAGPDPGSLLAFRGHPGARVPKKAKTPQPSASSHGKQLDSSTGAVVSVPAARDTATDDAGQPVTPIAGRGGDDALSPSDGHSGTGASLGGSAVVATTSDADAARGAPTLYDTSDDVRAAAHRRCLYGKRQRKQVAPIAPEPTAYDVWPARASNHGSSMQAAAAAGGGGADDTVGSSAAAADRGGAAADVSQLASVLSMPQLLRDLQMHVTEELEGLRGMYGDVPAAKNRLSQPPESELRRTNASEDGGVSEASIIAAVRANRHGRSKTGAKLLKDKSTQPRASSPTSAADGSGGAASTLSDRLGEPCSREDAFRIERVCLFSEVLAEFASHFKAYRPLLLWTLREFDDFAVYSHRHVWSPEARQEFQAEARRVAAESFESERAALQAKIVDLNNGLAEVNDRLQKYEASQATVRLQLDERDRVIANRDKELAENAEGRAALLARITRLEKELWQQRMHLEEPEKRIQELSQSNKDLQDKVVRGQRLYEELDREKGQLRDRADRIEEQLRETKKKQAQSGTNALMKAEMMVYKKRELDVLEMNAKLQAKIEHLEERYGQMVEALKISRGDRPTTPRPNWEEFTDVVSLTAPSTMKRVQELAGAYRQLADVRDSQQREILQVQQMLGSAYRDDVVAIPPGGTIASHPEAAPGLFLASEHVMPAMRAKWFPKMGLGESVPGYLKGNGRVPNLRFGRDAMQVLVRNLWMDRQSVKAGAPWDMFLSKFLGDHCGDVKPDIYAYNVHHAMQWYSYDPFIGFTRSLILGVIDEAVFVDMQQGVAKLRSDLLRAAWTAHRASKSEQDGGTGDGTTLTKAKLASALVESCIERCDVDVKQLIVAASRDCPGRTLDVELLFNFDGDRGRFSNFLEELYLQYLNGRRNYLASIIDAIYDSEPDEEGRLFPPLLATVLQQVDPNVPAQYLDDTVARAFSVSIEQLFPAVDKYTEKKTVGLEGERVYGCQDTVTSDVADVIALLSQGVVRRFMPPETAAAAGARPASPLVDADSPAAAAGSKDDAGAESKSGSSNADELDEVALEAIAA